MAYQTKTVPVIRLNSGDNTGKRETNRFLRAFLRNRLAVTGVVLVSLLIFLAAFAPLLLSYDPNKTNYSAILQPPSAEHLMGTDEYGRDLFTRIAYGAQISLVIAFVAQAVSMSIGVTIGLVAGWYGGWVDDFLMRVTDGFFAIPTLMFLIVWTAILEPTKESIFFALGLIGWTGIARLMRAQVLVTREQEYVVAAQAVGASTFRIMLQHIIPNAFGPIIVLASLGAASAILAESTLSFLGLGVKIPNPSWGTMIDIGRNYMTSAWWYALFPGFVIMLTVLGFNFIGDGLRDALDARQQSG